MMSYQLLYRDNIKLYKKNPLDSKFVLNAAGIDFIKRVFNINTGITKKHDTYTCYLIKIVFERTYNELLFTYGAKYQTCSS